MNRFFLEKNAISPPLISITGSDVNHIKNVLRKKTGDKIMCLDGSGTEYTAEITSIRTDSIEAMIINETKYDTASEIKISLIQGLPKLSKMDDIIKRSTELGASSIIPVITERTIAKGSKLERWQKIAKEASEQSCRKTIPQVSEVQSLETAIKYLPAFDLKLIAWEGEKENTLKSVLHKNKCARSIAVLIGPEGGFSLDEADFAKAKGFTSVSLGKRILRTENAGPVVAGIIMYEMEE